MIIGLTGAAGCGKSTAAAYLSERHGYARVRISGPLKEMLRAFLATQGLDPEEIERRIEGDKKQKASPELCGRSPRYVMQMLGTEWGRGLIHPDFWTRAWIVSARKALASGAVGVIAEDVRYPNEAAAVLDAGGIVVRILRPIHNLPDVGNHASEAQNFEANTVVDNRCGLSQFHARLDEMVALAKLAA